jgi:hypothetical protein
MARIKTGVSKKSNRQNLEALAIAQTWNRQFGIGVKMSPEFAWVFSNGKVGSKPNTWGQSGQSFEAKHGEPVFSTIKIALMIVKAGA